MHTKEIVALVGVGLLLLSWWMLTRAKNEFYLTCPSPDSYIKPFRLKKDDAKALVKRCEKVMPTGKTGDIDTEIDQCMTSCYPGFSFMMKDEMIDLCKDQCKNKNSKECLECVRSFQCEQTIGNQFPFVCSNIGAAASTSIKKFTADELKAYEQLMKSI